ncbi:VWA domain-containing protein [Leptolyngbya sp. 15MV]|nr:VWA domain-containing protein [Leptolyngbya sp. 15MV]
MGPTLDSLAAMLEERKRKILQTYETATVQRLAQDAARQAARGVRPPKDLRDRVRRALDEEQIADLERLWYESGAERSPMGSSLLDAIERLGEKYQVEELASRYAFTGRTAMDVPTALEVKEELEAIDRLLEQLREAMRNAQLAVVDMDELARFAEEAQLEQLRELSRQIEEYLRQQAELQGLEQSAEGFRLTPRAMRLFQGRLLSEIFASLEASRSGRHQGPIEGDGAVELPATRPYEFGDSAAHMDVTQTFINAMIRQGPPPAAAGSPEGAPPRPARGVSLRASDIEIHRTRNNPKCATAVLMDMSGSMRHDGQYVNCKRMALALDGLIRREYPGDFLAFIEMYTLAKIRPIAEVPGLMPKPVTIHNPVVRLKADMSDPRLSEMQIPPHFTNIQHALRLARQVLAPQDTPNRQVILLTDGLPTAHFEGSDLFLLYPPDTRTEEATMREAMLAKRDGITINIFLLPSWWQSSEDVGFAHRIAEQTGGRVFFTAGKDVDRYVLWDYVKQRRTIIG